MSVMPEISQPPSKAPARPLLFLKNGRVVDVIQHQGLPPVETSRTVIVVAVVRIRECIEVSAAARRDAQAVRPGIGRLECQTVLVFHAEIDLQRFVVRVAGVLSQRDIAVAQVRTVEIRVVAIPRSGIASRFGSVSGTSLISRSSR